jgi:integrase
MKESSFYENMKKIERLILPTFGTMKVVDIKPLTVLNWQNMLIKKDYSHKYKTTLRWLLNAILTYGNRYYDLPNCLPKVEGFRNLKRKKPKAFWTPEQFNKFVGNIPPSELHTFFMFLYYTGCRKGEAEAVGWSDIDFAAKTVTFDKSITRKIRGKAWAETSTKNTYSDRCIPLPAVLIDELQQLKIAAGKGAYVFGGAIPYNEQYITRNLDKYAAMAELPRITPHCFRHSHASYLLSSGVNIVAVSKRLGHASVIETLNTYGHYMPKDNTHILEKLDNVQSLK